MEARGDIGWYNPGTDEYTVWMSSQTPHIQRLLLTAFVTGIPEHKVRTISPDVGGAFGSKIFCYADMALVMFASKQIGGRPVKWVEGRRENYQSHHPRPRPRHVRGGGRQARRRGHRPARQDLRQPRRPPLDDRPGHPDDALRPRPVRVLQDPERLLRGHRRLHEHDVRGRVPRRRPARGDLRRRAGDGPVRQRDRDGSGGDPAQELHPTGRLPVRQPVRPAHRERWRQDLRRLGQLRAGAEQGARGGRLRPARGEEGRGEVARQAPRHGPLHVHRGVRRRALEVDRRGRRGLGRGDVGIGQHPGPPHRQDRRHDGHPVARPGPRDDLLPDRGPGARHPDGGHRRPALGHAGHAVRLRHVRQPDLERGQHRGDQGRGQDPGQGPALCGPHARSLARRHRGRRRRVPRQGLARQDEDAPGDRLRARPRVRRARRHGAVPRRDRLPRHPELHVPVRDAHRRGGDRRGDRQGRPRALPRGRRRRQEDQPDDRRRAAARRHRPGRRPGALGTGHLQRRRPAAHRVR